MPRFPLAVALIPVVVVNVAAGKVTQFPDVVAVASRGNANLDVFARGMDNALWRKGTTSAWFSSDTTGWTAWESWGGQIMYGPGAAVISQRIVVAMIGTDRALWSRWGDRSVTTVVGVHQFDLTPLITGGGQLTSSPALCAEEKDKYWAYGLGLDGRLWRTNWSPNQWSAWEKVPGLTDVVGSSPEIVCGDIGIGTSRPSGVSLGGVAVFNQWRGAVWQLADHFGNGRRSLGAPPGGARSAPAVAFDYLSARYLVCVVGGDSRVWCQFGDAPSPFDEREWNEQTVKVVTWSGQWMSLGGDPVTSAPAATWTGWGGVAVVARRKDNAVWLKRSADFGNTWNDWLSLGGQVRD